jgi:hypothetical protein
MDRTMALVENFVQGIQKALGAAPETTPEQPNDATPPPSKLAFPPSPRWMRALVSQKRNPFSMHHETDCVNMIAGATATATNASICPLGDENSPPVSWNAEHRNPKVRNNRPQNTHKRCENRYMNRPSKRTTTTIPSRSGVGPIRSQAVEDVTMHPLQTATNTLAAEKSILLEPRISASIANEENVILMSDFLEQNAVIRGFSRQLGR